VEISDLVWDVGLTLEDDDSVVGIPVFDCLFEFALDSWLSITAFAFGFDDNSLAGIVECDNMLR
jgi:hypothetical protein